MLGLLRASAEAVWCVLDGRTLVVGAKFIHDLAQFGSILVVDLDLFALMRQVIVCAAEEFLTILAVYFGLRAAEEALGVVFRHVRLIQLDLRLNHMGHRDALGAADDVLHLEASPLIRLGGLQIHTVIVLFEIVVNFGLAIRA